MVQQCPVLALVDPPTTLRSDARRNREAVVAAAVCVLCARPAASMQEIAEASGVGRTTLYRHFASRDELIGELLARVAAEGNAIVLEAVAEQGPALEVLDRLCRRLVELGDRYRFLVDYPPGRPAADDQAPLTAYVRRAQRRGELRSDLPATWIREALRGLAMTALGAIAAGDIDAARAAQLVAATFTASVAPQPPT
jgi:AcrR family transcriptional regulator